MTRRKKQVQIEDTIYDIDAAYRAGSKAHKEGISYKCNPHRGNSYAHDQWNRGHCHEDDPETKLEVLLQKAF